MKTKLNVLIAFLIPAFLVTGLGTPAVAGPSDAARAGEERPVSEFIDVAAEGDQSQPTLAFHPSGHGFAAWIDDRTATPRVYGALLTEGLDSKVVGAEISEDEGFPHSPHVVATDTGFTVAWVSESGDHAEIRLATFDAEGRRAGKERSVGRAQYGSQLAMDSAARTTLVVYIDEDDDLVGRLLDATGEPKSVSFEIYDEGLVHAASVASGGEGFLVTFGACTDDGADCRFGARSARVLSSGKVLDPDGLPLDRKAPDLDSMDAAWDGDRFLVIWKQEGSVTATRVSFDQRPGSRTPFRVGGATPRHPQVHWTGSTHLVTWIEAPAEIASAIVPANVDAAVNTGAVRGADGYSRQALANSGADVVMLWDHYPRSRSDVLATSFSSQGVPRDEVAPLVQSAFGQIHPSISPGAGMYLSLWQDYRAHSGPIVYGARIAGSGEVLDPRGFKISLRNGRHPIAAANGASTWLVLWREKLHGRTLTATRVGADGSVQDQVPIPITTDQGRKTDVAVAADGAGWLVLYRNARTETLNSVHVSPEGVPGEPRILVREARSPDVLWDEDRYIAVWSRNGNIQGAYLSPQGELLDAPRKITTNGLYDIEPSIGSSGTSMLVAWSRCNEQTSCAAASIFTMVLDASLDDGDPVKVQHTSSFDTEPEVTWDGRAFSLAWKRCKRPATCLRPTGAVVYLAPDGSALSATTEVAEAHAIGTPAFSVATLGEGSTVFIYRKVDGPAAATGVPRAYFRTTRQP